MKTVSHLSKDEMTELKQRYLDNHLLETEDRTASYGELSCADDIVPDSLIAEAYGHYVFTENDFFCNERNS